MTTRIQKLTSIEFEEINKRLRDRYGLTEDKANFRIVWSEDEMEKRWIDTTREGLKLLTPEIKEVPKYRQYIHDKYVLERLTAIDEFGGEKGTQLINRLSYEPLWVFEDKSGNYLPAHWGASKVIIENMLESVRTAGFTKYKDPDSDPEESAHAKTERISEIESALFGNETVTGDALAYREGIVVPANYSKEIEK